MHIYHTDRDLPKPLLASPTTGITESVSEAATSQQVMTKAKLDWRVIEKRLQTTDGIDVSTHKALFREDTMAQLGVVGDGFEPLQNAEAFAFCDGLISRGKVQYVSAGQFSAGARVFIQCRILRDLSNEGGTEVAKGDHVLPYFMLANGHDGSLAVRAILTPIRVICQNTFQMALRKAKGKGARTNSVSIKHTRNMQERLEASKAIFGWAEQSFTEFIAQARATVSKKITTEAKLKAFFRETFKVDEANILAEDGFAQIKNREERLSELFMEGAGQANPAVRGTAWAALNAVTQYLDHEARTTVRGVDLENLGPDERDRLSRMKRFESNVLGGNAGIKARALQLALAI